MFRWRMLVRLGLAAALLALPGAVDASAAPKPHPKLDKTLNRRADTPGRSLVIVTFKEGVDLTADIARLGGKPGRRLRLINGQAAELPNGQLRQLAGHPAVASIHWDRPTRGTMNRAAVVVGARAVQWLSGYDGAGVGVAVVDSGITSWHDDLTYNGTSTAVRTSGGQRLVKFVDLVNGQPAPYDDNGHGTHVAGIIAGNGYDSFGARAGIAPAAHLIGLKVLDRQGRGVISNVIAALDFVVANKTAYNIRVANLSVGASVQESYNTDPLTLAARRAVEAGVVVVTAAGNLGRNAEGETQYGGITAPGNAPWVLTVGAYSHEGTVTRLDDVMANYSSRGPTAYDYAAKPDVVAPGTGIVSLSDPTSLFYTTKESLLMSGSFSRPYKPYLSLTGTSMASPIVAGTVALMMQANPSLTPNLAKAIIQYTAQEYPNYSGLVQGAGFLNTKGAVDLARFFARAKPGDSYPTSWAWSRKIIWGNHRLSGGAIKPNGTAWALNIVWGTALDPQGLNIVWGTECPDSSCFNIVWGTMDAEFNIVWGTASEEDNIVWGTFFDEAFNIVWGTAVEEDNIVWGTDCAGANCENVVWGASIEEDNIVWGTAAEEDNIVWGTNGEMDNIVWGTSSDDDDVTWGSSGEDTPLFDDPDAEAEVFDVIDWDQLFEPSPAEEPMGNTLEYTEGMPGTELPGTTMATSDPASGGEVL